MPIIFRQSSVTRFQMWQIVRDSLTNYRNFSLVFKIMNDVSHVNTQLMLSLETLLAASILGVVLILYLNRRKLKLAFRTRYCLGHLGLEQISNIQFDDGLGGYFTIDRLLLRHHGITLLVYKRYSGRIFCADHIDEWTQMLGQKSYLFKNPLFELNYQIKVLQALYPDISINGYLFFDHTVEFPKGCPRQVIHPGHIPAELERKNRHQVEPKVMDVWRELMQRMQNK